MTINETNLDTAQKVLAFALKENARLLGICEHVHDRLLRGDDDKSLMDSLSKAWKDIPKKGGDVQCPDCGGDGMRKWKSAVQPGANMSCKTCESTGFVSLPESADVPMKVRDMNDGRTIIFPHDPDCGLVLNEDKASAMCRVGNQIYPTHKLDLNFVCERCGVQVEKPKVKR
jgi:predicted RNA-binding Zn-ribbon protein involved in translation (DUF1610 family)